GTLEDRDVTPDVAANRLRLVGRGRRGVDLDLELGAIREENRRHRGRGRGLEARVDGAVRVLAPAAAKRDLEILEGRQAAVAETRQAQVQDAPMRRVEVVGHALTQCSQVLVCEQGSGVKLRALRLGRYVYGPAVDHTDRRPLFHRVDG